MGWTGRTGTHVGMFCWLEVGCSHGATVVKGAPGAVAPVVAAQAGQGREGCGETVAAAFGLGRPSPWSARRQLDVQVGPGHAGAPDDGPSRRPCAVFRPPSDTPLCKDPPRPPEAIPFCLTAFQRAQRPASQRSVPLVDNKGAGIQHQENKSPNLSANWETVPLLSVKLP